jgi:ribosomal protein L29
MKRSDLQDLRAKSVDELKDEIDDCRKQLMDGRIAGVVEGKGLGMQAHNLRRHIARCLTLINDKEQAEVKA